jgi:hypothetical protein
MSAIFPYVGFNYSSSAPCLGGLPILRSPKKLSGQGITKEVSRSETNFEENSLASGSGNNPEQTAAPLNKNSAEVAQADTKHNEGKRRLDEQINSSSFGTRNKVAMRILTIGAVLALLPGCILGPYSEKGPNTGSPQTQGIVKSEELYNLLRASEVPREVNGRNVSMNLPHVTTEPEKLEK